MPTPIMKEMLHSQMPPTSVETTSSTEKSPQSQSTPHPTIELTLADFPELPHKTQQHQNERNQYP